MDIRVLRRRDIRDYYRTAIVNRYLVFTITATYRVPYQANIMGKPINIRPLQRCSRSGSRKKFNSFSNYRPLLLPHLPLKHEHISNNAGNVCEIERPAQTFRVNRE